MSQARQLLSSYIPPVPPPGATHTAQTRAAFFNYEEQTQRHDIAFKYHFLRSRKWISIATFCCVWTWLAVILLYIYCAATGKAPCFKTYGFMVLPGVQDFKLSDAVVITLITTTTASILIGLHIIIRNLFPLPKGAEKSDGLTGVESPAQ